MMWYILIGALLGLTWKFWLILLFIFPRSIIRGIRRGCWRCWFGKLKPDASRIKAIAWTPIVCWHEIKSYVYWETWMGATIEEPR